MLEIFKSDKKARLIEIPVDLIETNPRQPRKVFSNEGLIELSESIKRYGVIQPITVRKNKNKYELIAGERRLRACKLAGLKTIRSMVIEANNCDSAALALIENLQRENLNFLDEADAYSNLIIDFGLTQEEVAARMGKTQATIANKLRILRLEPSVKKIIRENKLTERHARALLKLPEVETQLKVLETVCAKELNVKQTEELIESYLQPKKKSEPTKKPKRLFRDVRIFVNTIKQAVDIMKQSGIHADMEKVENDDYIEYVVRIPK